MPEFHCGESLCKKRVEEEFLFDQRWPVRCKYCRVSLYPRDVLDETPLNELAPMRTVLQKKVGGRLVEANASDVGGVLQELAWREATAPRESAGVGTAEPVAEGERAAGSEPSDWNSPWVLLLAGLVIGLSLGGVLYRLFS